MASAGARTPADNAVARRDTPNFDRLWAACPHAFLHTSGDEVGLAGRPDGQFRGGPPQHRRRPRGAPGTGPHRCRHRRRQPRRNRPALLQLDRGRTPDRAAPATCSAWSRMAASTPTRTTRPPWHASCAEAGVHVAVHAFTDGRDTAPRIGLKLHRAPSRRRCPPGAAIATVSGRYYAMDRDNRWDRVDRAWRAIALRGRRPVCHRRRGHRGRLCPAA